MCTLIFNFVFRLYALFFMVSKQEMVTIVCSQQANSFLTVTMVPPTSHFLQGIGLAKNIVSQDRNPHRYYFILLFIFWSTRSLCDRLLLFPPLCQIIWRINLLTSLWFSFSTGWHFYICHMHVSLTSKHSPLCILGLHTWY